jgi:hypothetical protein
VRRAGAARRFRASGPALLLALLLGGCYPYVAIDRPAVSGRVVTEDGEPLADVPVYVCSTAEPVWASADCVFAPGPRTDAAGAYAVAERSHWALFSPVTKQAPPALTVAAACFGREVAAAVSCADGDRTVDIDRTRKRGARVLTAEGCALPPERRDAIAAAAKAFCASLQKPVAKRKKKARSHGE